MCRGKQSPCFPPASPRFEGILEQSCPLSPLEYRRIWAVALTGADTSARLRKMAPTRKTKRNSGQGSNAIPRTSKSLKNKADKNVAAHAEAVRQMVDPLFEQQLKVYEQAVQHFQQQKLAKAKELLEKAIAGPSKEQIGRASCREML